MTKKLTLLFFMSTVLVINHAHADLNSDMSAGKNISQTIQTAVTNGEGSIADIVARALKNARNLRTLAAYNLPSPFSGGDIELIQIILNAAYSIAPDQAAADAITAVAHDANIPTSIVTSAQTAFTPQTNDNDYQNSSTPELDSEPVSDPTTPVSPT